ncbi:DegT/DnrJ/EryC1/StrS family aminotransferase [Vibrio lentus]
MSGIKRSTIRLSKSSISETEKLAVSNVLQQEYLGMGNVTYDFEVALANYLSIKPDLVAAVNTGTSALHIALSAIDIKPGDEVLVPSLTYVASFQAISALGATPIACEVLSGTLFLDPKDVERKITPRSKAIMPVHYASSCKGIECIYRIAKMYDLRVVEDAAQSFGSLYQGKPIGTNSDIICFSFDGIKNITCGEGGAVVSNDIDVINKVKDSRLLGVMKDTEMRYSGKRSWDFDVKDQGFRYHMSNINAAIGIAQLGRIQEFKNKRQLLAKNYVRELTLVEEVDSLDFSFDEIMPHIFVIKALDRDGLRNYLLDQGIEVGVHYKPNHKLSKYKNGMSLPITDQIYSEILTLPLHFDLTFDDQKHVINSIKEFYER